jgi:ATP-dependent DNA ligase
MRSRPAFLFGPPSVSCRLPSMRWIAEAARRNRTRQFVVDGEAVVLGIDGRADFNALHSRQHDAEVQLCLRCARALRYLQ